MKRKIRKMTQNSITNSQKLSSQIIEHEGMIPYAYQDSLGFWTIGVGRLIDKRKGGKLSLDEIQYLLNNDIKDCWSSLGVYRWFSNQDEVRQGVLVELMFNMGLPNLLGFSKMIAALTIKDYLTAAQELLSSKWAKQVGITRIQNIQHRLLTGTYP